MRSAVFGPVRVGRPAAIGERRGELGGPGEVEVLDQRGQGDPPVGVLVDGAGDYAQWEFTEGSEPQWQRVDQGKLGE